MFRFQRSVVTRALVFFAVVLALPVSTLAGHGSARAATLPSVSVNDVSVAEGTGGTTTLTFTITQNIPGKSKVVFVTANDTAKAPSDYIARSGSVRFAGKKLTRTVAVTIVTDALDEPDEAFFLKLTGATGATIADGEGVGTILDDDPPPIVQVPSTLAVPEGQTGDTTIASIDVTLTAPSGKAVSVAWATADGTVDPATEGDDYLGGSGTLHFAPGETDKVVLITVIGDVTNESDETFTVALSSPVNATLGTTPDTVTIVDNDPLPAGVPIFNVKDVKKREGSSGTTTLTFTVTRSDDTTSVATVDYTVSNGTAVAPSDFAAVPAGTFSFLAGVTKKTLNVTVKGDRTLERSESLFLTLNNPSIGAAIEDGQGTGTIVNDDTKTTVVIKIRAAKHLVAVHGRVSPARSGKHAVVRLYRKRNGVWVRLLPNGRC